MKPPIQLLAGLKGTIMVFALVIILAGTLVLAAWAQMMATAAAHPDTTAQGVQNRIALENARALLRQYMLVSLPSGASRVNVTWEASIAGGAWGGCSVNAASAFWSTTNQEAGNQFSPLGGTSFVMETLANLSNSVQTKLWKALVKSRSPFFLGYPVVLHNPVNTGSSAFSWVTNASVIYRTNVMTNRPNISGAVSIPFTSGTNASGAGTNGFLGYFAAPVSTQSQTNASGEAVLTNAITYTNYYTNSAIPTSTNSTNVTGGTNFTIYYTSGRAAARLSTSQTNSLLRYDVTTSVPTYSTTNKVTNGSGANRRTNTYFRYYTNMSLTNLQLAGTNITNTLHIVVASTNTNLTILTLTNTANSRQIVVNVQRTSAIELRTATTDASYDWKLALSSLAPVNMTVPGGSGRSLTVTGGLRSDQLLSVNSGSLNVRSETNASFATDISSDRILWIEDGPNQ